MVASAVELKHPRSAWSRRAQTGARLLLGGIFFVFGLNGLLHFFVQPTPAPGAAAMLSALMATGYFWQFLKVTEISAGFLLLSNRFVPLALTILAPVLVNITAYYAALDIRGIPMMVVMVGAEIYLAWSYRRYFAPMLVARTQAAGSEA